MTENDLRSRIPRPVTQAVRAPLKEQNHGPSTRATRKRAASPAAPPPTRRRVGRPTIPPTAAVPPPPRAGAGSKRNATPPAPPSAESKGFDWSTVAAETGWSVEECLAQRLTFPKHADPRARLERLSEHLSRLRAAGRHLLAARREEAAARAAECADLRLELQQVHASGAAAEERRARAEAEAEAAREEAAERRGEAQGCAERAEELASRLQASLEALQGAEQAGSSARREAEEAERRLASTRAALAQAESSLQRQQERLDQLQDASSRVAEALAAAGEAARRAERERAAALKLEAEARGASAALEARAAGAERAREAADAARVASAAEAAELRAARAALEGRLAEAERQVADGQGAAATEGPSARAAPGAALQAALQEALALAREESALAAARAERSERERAGAEARAVELAARLERAEGAVEAGEGLRRRLHNALQEMRGNVRVFCRVRGGGEADRERLCVRVKAAASASGEDDDCAAILAARLESVVVEHKAGAGASEFSFDRVFGPAASQAQVFAEVSQLVQSALDGFDVCIFAYGQTSSGKTHSMLGGGGAGQEGVVPRAAKQLAAAVEQAAKRGWELGLEAAALEIYNDDVVDLLGAGAPQGKKLQVVQDEEWGTAVTHLAWVPLGSPEAIQTVLAQAAQKRAVSATALNASSSRSHLVFQLRLRGFHAASDARLRSQLSLVDLAGSERAARTGAQGAQLVEAQHINKSLSALGDVVAALKARAPHVPYRNCRLAHVLAGCLGSPSAKSLMLVHVAPEAANAQESVCSLRFAEKVHKVAVGAKK